MKSTSPTLFTWIEESSFSSFSMTSRALITYRCFRSSVMCFTFMALHLFWMFLSSQYTSATSFKATSFT